MIKLIKAESRRSHMNHYYLNGLEYYIGHKDTIYKNYHYCGNYNIPTKTTNKNNITQCELFHLGLFELILIRRCEV